MMTLLNCIARWAFPDNIDVMPKHAVDIWQNMWDVVDVMNSYRPIPKV